MLKDAEIDVYVANIINLSNFSLYFSLILFLKSIILRSTKKKRKRKKNGILSKSFLFNACVLLFKIKYNKLNKKKKEKSKKEGNN